MTAIALSRRDARRLAVRAQWLDRERPPSLLELVRHLTMLPVDPTAAVAPSADLVAWSRLGSPYEPAELVRALTARKLVELRGVVRPAEDIVLFRAEMQRWRDGHLDGWRKSHRNWLAANDACRRDVLRRLAGSGPLSSRELPDTCAVPWKSSGWTNNRNITQLLELMVLTGEVAVSGRRGNERLWDLAERVYPDAAAMPEPEAERRRNTRRLAALGIARDRGPDCQVEPIDVGTIGAEAVVEGVRGTWRVEPALLDQPFTGRAALLSPFDRFMHDRKRIEELFESDYVLEMYKPAASRRWGYFALPVLYGDRLVGKLDATADRKSGALRVTALHWDVEPSRTMTAAVDREIADLADWLELDLARAA